MRLTVYIMLLSVYACAQINDISAPGKTGQAEEAATRSIDGFALSESAQLESLDEYVGAVLDQQLNKIRSACDENKTLDQKLADIAEAYYGLSRLERQYNPRKHIHELSLYNYMRLAGIKSVLDSVMIFRGGAPTKELVLSRDYYYNFVHEYKFMYNLGDSIKGEDFKRPWARDFVRGLGCLYSVHPD